MIILSYFTSIMCNWLHIKEMKDNISLRKLLDLLFYFSSYHCLKVGRYLRLRLMTNTNWANG